MDKKSAKQYIQEATEIEEKAAFTFRPPTMVKPSFELFGEWLVTKVRKEEARQQFEKVLVRAPKRWLAMKGLENANS